MVLVIDLYIAVQHSISRELKDCKKQWTPLAIVKDQYSHLVYPNICIEKKTVKTQFGRRENNRRKTPLSHKLCAFRCLNSRPQLRSRIQFKFLYFFLKNYVTSEQAVSHNVLY